MSDYWQDQRYLAAHYAIHGRGPGEPERKPARILVTGSRLLTDFDLVSNALTRARDELGPDAVVVHGNARGADTLAHRVARTLGLGIERRPADWTNLGRKAGIVRNQEMVRDGADLCLVFLFAGAENRGSKDCWRRAERAGIPVRVFTQEAAR